MHEAFLPIHRGKCGGSDSLAVLKKHRADRTSARGAGYSFWELVRAERAFAVVGVRDRIDVGKKGIPHPEQEYAHESEKDNL